MEFLKKILWTLSIGFVYIGMSIKYLMIKRLAKKYAKDPISVEEAKRFKVVYKFAKTFLYSKRIKIKNIGKEKLENKPMLYVCNHKSNLDPIIVFKEIYEQSTPRPIFIAKSELAVEKISVFLDLIDTIYIERDNLRSVYNTIQKEVEVLKDKQSIVVFPEGTRVQTDEMGEFKAAALTPAYETLSAIQPIVLFNTMNLLETSPLSNKYNRTVKINFLKAIQSMNFVTRKKELFANEIRNVIQQEYNKMKEQK